MARVLVMGISHSTKKWGKAAYLISLQNMPKGTIFFNIPNQIVAIHLIHHMGKRQVSLMVYHHLMRTIDSPIMEPIDVALLSPIYVHLSYNISILQF